MKKIFYAWWFVFLPVMLTAQSTQDEFFRGADVSFTPQIESLGGKYTLNGVEKDALDILKENGVNYIRLRLWHTPAGGWCGLGQTLAYTQRVKGKGLKFLLDIHYSDWWADPGKQNKPAAWATLPYAALKESVYTYTKFVLASFHRQLIVPDMLQIGNEITAGMLWPDGRNNTAQGWIQFGELLKEGVRGAREGAADSSMKIMIHIDRGGDNGTARWFYDNLITQGVPFDVIGLSYYPWWHGSLLQMKNNVNDLAVRYNKPIVIAETAYPWTTKSLNDGMGNVGVDVSKLIQGCPVSAQGQKTFLARITKILKETTNGKGVGYFYWEPAYISVPPIGSSWEHLTLFDFTGSALSSVNAFLNLDSAQAITVRLKVNTATVWDTLKPSGVVQLRGEIIGKGSSLLPSGEVLTWDANTGVAPKNVGGDYWETQFKMYQGDRLEYKFWTGHSASVPTNLRLGNEGPVTPSDGSVRNIRLISAGARDTTIDLQFFNASGLTVPQFWSPLLHKPDSIGILFRVNMAGLMAKKLFDPALHGPVVVRGDSMQSSGVFSWSGNKVVLARETLSVAGGSFWSGTAYFPKNTIRPGTQIEYTFFAVNSAFDGKESGIAPRIVIFPISDTTLAWRPFNENRTVTDVRGANDTHPARFQLMQNYPNPFNPSTTIPYTLARSGSVDVTVYNILGQQVRTIVHRLEEAGMHAAVWDGTDDKGAGVRSGVYFVKLSAGEFVAVRKMIMQK
ncbi:MAG TPA: glycosyl hydrolase 53 family protein [Bacteroidota bacterium]|nr:glycosyl hydrolase 53 family protein [Bacteroidota bacterium]